MADSYDKIKSYKAASIALSQLITPEGIQASNWRLFKQAVFPRDSFQVALDLLRWYPDIAELAIFSAAKRQGERLDKNSEEEPGKIFHEYRNMWWGGVHADKDPEEKLADLGPRWGGSAEAMCYYGASDTTPQFVRLVNKYCKLYGSGILDKELKKDYTVFGEIKTLKIAVLEALNWIHEKLEISDIGLLEFKRHNPQGLHFQALRDGANAYLHKDGSPINMENWVAPIEVQGLAYDALLAGIRLFPEHSDVSIWRAKAEKLQEQIFKLFWIEEEQRFAMALDRDEQGGPRKVEISSVAGAELLETRIFDHLSEEEQVKYVGGQVSYIFDEDFMTSVGLRMRKFSENHFLDHWDYQGSWAVWPVTNSIIARGLRRFPGFISLAHNLEQRYVEGVFANDKFVEFWYVDESDSPVAPTKMREGIAAVPEGLQAWTVAAVIRGLYEEEHRSTNKPLWQYNLAQDLLAGLE